eukprot:scaffold10421_cov31-Tisochrysis_lutea.AAC.4
MASAHGNPLARDRWAGSRDQAHIECRTLSRQISPGEVPAARQRPAKHHEFRNRGSRQVQASVTMQPTPPMIMSAVGPGGRAPDRAIRRERERLGQKVARCGRPLQTP